MTLAKVMRSTASQRHRVNQFDITVISFYEAMPPSLQSTKSIFNHYPCSADFLVVDLLFCIRCPVSGNGFKLVLSQHSPHPCSWCKLQSGCHGWPTPTMWTVSKPEHHASSQAGQQTCSRKVPFHLQHLEGWWSARLYGWNSHGGTPVAPRWVCVIHQWHQHTAAAPTCSHCRQPFPQTSPGLENKFVLLPRTSQQQHRTLAHTATQWVCLYQKEGQQFCTRSQLQASTVWWPISSLEVHSCGTLSITIDNVVNFTISETDLRMQWVLKSSLTKCEKNVQKISPNKKTTAVLKGKLSVCC